MSGSSGLSRRGLFRVLVAAPIAAAVAVLHRPRREAWVDHNYEGGGFLIPEEFMPALIATAEARGRAIRRADARLGGGTPLRRTQKRVPYST